MSKTTVATLTADIKSLADYDITDSGLDALILKAMNFILKRMKQWFMDAMLYDEIGAHDTFTTTALQEYIDIATETPDLDQNIILTERTNDTPIEIITFSEYRKRFPDPSANTSVTADVAAFFGNRIYLGPTPTAVTTYYLDYVKLITKLIATDTLPFEDKYDELVVAGVMEYLVKWLDRSNTAMIKQARDDVFLLKKDLIVNASKNVGMNLQSASRNEGTPIFAPRKVIN